MMPEMDGKELCARVRELDSEHYIYIILMTAHCKVVDLVDALGAGADEYMAKPIEMPELVARIVAASRFLDVDRELRKQVTVDTLTKLSNRHTFMEILSREHAKSRRYNLPLSLVMLDVDAFKSVNDQHGKAVGDTVLKSVGHVARKQLQNIGYVGRMTDDKFCMLLPNIEPDCAAAYAEGMRAQVADAMIVTDHASIAVTASLGIAHAAGTDETDADFVNRAARSLLAAKQSGRNRVGPALQTCDMTETAGSLNMPSAAAVTRPARPAVRMLQHGP